jgi:protein-L-isoaspartate(D-aspartate) O-methyltransferase
LAIGDGSLGISTQAPFDAINVAAAAESIPAALEQQLAPGGRLVMPVGGEDQYLVRVRRASSASAARRSASCRW